MAQWLDARIKERIDWNDHLFSLRFACEDFPGFKAGQFTKIGLEVEPGKILSRPYSLVNSPDAALLEIIAVPIEQGRLSPQLHKLHVGERLKVMAPATGFLVMDEVPPSENLYLIATGTGVGPFLSILHTEQPWEKFKNITLVYAARLRSDLAYLESISQITAQRGSRFQFVAIVSREDAPDALRGRIPPLLAQGKIQQHSQRQITADTTQVMLCGNPDMINDTHKVLEDLGLKKHLRRSPGQISVERYW